MNTTVVNNSGCVHLDVSIWSARARLRREDIPDADKLPPEDLATMGSKRLFDPAKMRIFNTLKARALCGLDKMGVRFLGGWLMHEDKMDKANQMLEGVASEFNAAVQDFLASYDAETEEWLKAFPQWAGILRNALPSKDALRGKFKFHWQLFKVEPIAVATTSNGNNLGATIGCLGDTALEEVAGMIRDIYEEVFKGKATVTRKSLRPVRTVLQKLDGLSYLHSDVGAAHAFLRDAFMSVDDTEKLKNPDIVRMFSGLLSAMSSAEAIKALCARRQTEQKTDVLSMFDAATGRREEPAVPVEPDEMNDLLEKFKATAGIINARGLF